MNKGSLAVVTFILAFISWVIVVFYGQYLKNKTKTLVFTRILAISIVGFFLSFQVGVMGGSLFVAFHLIIIFFFLFFLEIVFLSIPKFRTYLPLCAGLCSIVVFTPILKFFDIAYDMWKSKASPGAIKYREETSLAVMHILFIVLCIILILVLRSRYLKREYRSLWFSVIGSIVYIVCISISFFYTVPRSGSEGILLWMFIVPGFIMADFFLITTILKFTISSIARQTKKSNTKFGLKGISTDKQND